MIEPAVKHIEIVRSKLLVEQKLPCFSFVRGGCIVGVCLLMFADVYFDTIDTDITGGFIDMTKQTGKVTFMGNPLTLVGNEVKIGDQFPQNIPLLTTKLTPFDISSEPGVKVVTTVPSLDTPVCDMQVRKFNEKAASLKAKIYAVSADLPFAQARWCGATGVERVMTLSDHASMALADALGIHVKELRLLARTVFIIDAQGKIVYRQIVDEITSEPDYEAALRALAQIS